MALITVYLTGVLDRLKLALGRRGLATLYALLYWILRSEDYSLLMGALLLFGLLAILMTTATRRLVVRRALNTKGNGGGPHFPIRTASMPISSAPIGVLAGVHLAAGPGLVQRDQ